MTYYVELKGEDLSCYWNKIEPVSLRKCPYDHRLTNKAYLSAITMPVPNISQSFTYKMVEKIKWHRYGTKLRHSHPAYTYQILILGAAIPNALISRNLAHKTTYDIVFGDKFHLSQCNMLPLFCQEPLKWFHLKIIPLT